MAGERGASGSSIVRETFLRETFLPRDIPARRIYQGLTVPQTKARVSVKSGV
jgi:hypothetical protein